jgi:hypothetical protein
MVLSIGQRWRHGKASVSGNQDRQGIVLPQIPIIMVESTVVEKAVTCALSGLPVVAKDAETFPTTVLGRSAASPLGHAVASYFEGRGFAVRLRTPPSWRDVLGGQRWTSVPIGNPAARYPMVSVPDELAPPRPVIVIADLDVADAAPMDVPIGYVHPRLRLAVRMSHPDSGAAADVTLGFQLIAVLLSATVNERRITAATTDLVAGHLLALAIRTLLKPPDEDRTGPWEDAVVQRATEIGVGARHPGQLHLNCWPEESESLALLSDQICLVLGLA